MKTFRHLLALAIVLLFGVVLIFSLVRAGQDPQQISTVLQAVTSSLGGLIGAIIGYYFGESAGRRQPPTEDVTPTEVKESAGSDDGFAPVGIQPDAPPGPGGSDRENKP